MLNVFLAVSAVVGVALMAIVVSVYREIIRIEDGSDWFYE